MIPRVNVGVERQRGEHGIDRHRRVMTRKVCLRCDWHGDTAERDCPDCGERPLYLIDGSAPRKAEKPLAADPSERGQRETGAAAAAPVLPPGEPAPAPSQTGADGPSRRRDRVVVPLVLVALVLTIALGTWFTGRAQRPPPTASSGVIGAGDSDAPSPTQSVSLPPSPAEGAPIGRANVGRHVLTVGDVPLSFRMPAPGWERFGRISLNKSILGPQGAEAMLYWSSFPEGDRADPCGTLVKSPIGPSAADLADAVATAPGTELVKASDMTVGGRPARRVILTVREPHRCNPGFFFTWQDVKGGAFFPRTTVGDTIRVWIVDVRGTRLFFAAVTTEQSDSELERQIRAIIGSIRFLEPRVLERVEIAERFMEARNGYDIETAMSLLAEPGATALLMSENAMLRHMPTVRLNRHELMLALEAEQLYGVRYQHFRCRPDPVGWSHTQVTCSYQMDSRLRQLAGLPAVESSFGIGIGERGITNLSFPWLSVGYPGGEPKELADFVAWMGAEHPEAGQVYEDGELFTTMGQELVHILTRRSVDLLATYLGEYERSLTG